MPAISLCGASLAFKQCVVHVISGLPVLVRLCADSLRDSLVKVSRMG